MYVMAMAEENTFSNFSPLKTPRKIRKEKLSHKSKTILNSPSEKINDEQNNIAGSGDIMISAKSKKRKKSVEDYELPQVNNVIINSITDSCSSLESPRKKKKHKLSSCKKSVVENEDSKNNEGTVLSPANESSQRSSKKKKRDTGISSSTIQAMKVERSSSMDELAETSSENIKEKVNRSLPEAHITPRKTNTHSVLHDTPKTSRGMNNSYATLTKLKQHPSVTTSGRDSSVKTPTKANKKLSYNCPKEFAPFSKDICPVEYVTSEDCNSDHCKLFLIKTPADFPIYRLPKKLALNGVQSFHSEKIRYEVHSFLDKETSALTSLVHNSETNELEEGPSFVGQIQVIESLTVPVETNLSQPPESQEVPFPEGLHIRYTPFGAADPVCFSTEHLRASKSKKKHKKSKDISTDEIERTCDSPKKKKKKKKKHWKSD